MEILARLYEVTKIEDASTNVGQRTRLTLKKIGGPSVAIFEDYNVMPLEVSFVMLRREAAKYQIGNFFWLRLSE